MARRHRPLFPLQHPRRNRYAPASSQSPLRAGRLWAIRLLRSLAPPPSPQTRQKLGFAGRNGGEMSQSLLRAGRLWAIRLLRSLAPPLSPQTRRKLGFAGRNGGFIFLRAGRARPDKIQKTAAHSKGRGVTSFPGRDSPPQRCPPSPSSSADPDRAGRSGPGRRKQSHRQPPCPRSPCRKPRTGRPGGEPWPP